LRLEDLAPVTWSAAGDYPIVEETMTSSRRRDHLAAVPRVSRLDHVLDLLERRYRAAGVDTVLVNSKVSRGTSTR